MERTGKYAGMCRLLLCRRIFVSSTTRDLLDVRAELAHHLTEKGCTVLMFDWGVMRPAPGVSPPEQCVKNVAEADAFILLLGSRWGYEMPDGRSATEAEYDAAYRMRIPRLVFARKFAWDFVQAVRRAGTEVRENGPLQKGKADRIVGFYQKVADSAPGKVADFVTPFDSSVDLKEVVVRHLDSLVAQPFNTPVTQVALKAFAEVMGVPHPYQNLARAVKELRAAGHETLGSLANHVRKKKDFRPSDLWDLVATLLRDIEQPEVHQGHVVCIDKRVVTPYDLELWKRLLETEPSGGRDGVDLDHLFAQVPGHLWPAMQRLLRLTAYRWGATRSVGRKEHQSELTTIVNYLWHEYVHEEISQIEDAGHSKRLRFWATDTAFEDLSPSVWTTEDFHVALLNSTIKLAQQHPSLEFGAVRLCLVRSPGRLLTPSTFPHVQHFFERHVSGGVTCGIVPVDKINKRFANLFRDFYLVPQRVLCRVLRKSSVHVITTYEDQEGKKVLRQYEEFYEHLLGIALMIDTASIKMLHELVTHMDESC